MPIMLITGFRNVESGYYYCCSCRIHETGNWAMKSLQSIFFFEKEMATHCSILAWKISWTVEARGLQSMGSQRVAHGWATNFYLLTYLLLPDFCLLSLVQVQLISKTYFDYVGVFYCYITSYHKLSSSTFSLSSYLFIKFNMIPLGSLLSISQGWKQSISHAEL